MAQSQGLLDHPMVGFLAEHASWIGLVLRLFLAWFLPWLLDDGRLVPEVAYTDIDFHIFSDAAAYVQRGQSPYDRHTYRYTPFLAEFLAHLPHRELGRYSFCLADALCGWIIVGFRRSDRRSQRQKLGKEAGIQSDTTWMKLQDAIWWCYNPLAINICTRGSSESLMVLLPVLLTVWLISGTSIQGTTSPKPTVRQALIAGISHGIAIHSKLYPIIYSLSFMAYLASADTSLKRTALLTQLKAFFTSILSTALARLFTFFCKYTKDYY